MIEEVEHKVKRIVIVGDVMVGKTSFAHSFAYKEFLTECSTPVFDKKELLKNVDDENYLIELYDIAGQDDYQNIREMAYKCADCFLLCYSVNDDNSYKRISSYWLMELKTAAKNIPIVLCATKVDLRKTEQNCISTVEGEKLKKQINANAFVECSAKENIFIMEAIDEAVRASIVGIPEKNCTIL